MIKTGMCGRQSIIIIISLSTNDKLQRFKSTQRTSIASGRKKQKLTFLLFIKFMNNFPKPFNLLIISIKPFIKSTFF